MPQLRRSALSAALATALVVTADPGAAEESTEFTTVVTGRRPPRSASDWTFAIGSEPGARPASSTAADLLREAPGVHISQHSGQGKAHQIFLRGFDAVHGQDVEIRVAGIPVNEVSNVHAQGYADLNFVPPEAVLRMRVLEGAFDPRQGDFAVAGSIALELGLARRGLLTRTSAGSHGLARQLVAWGPRGQRPETFVAAEVARADGFGPQRSWLRGSAIAQGLLELSDSWRLRLLGTTYATRYDAAGVVRQDLHEAGQVGFLDAMVDGQGGSSMRHQLLAELRFRRPLTRAAMTTYLVVRDLRLRHNFTGFRFVPQDLQTGAEPTPQGDMIEQQNDSVTVGGEASYSRVLSLLGRQHRLEAGVMWRHDRVDQDQRRLRDVDGGPWFTGVDAALSIVDIGLYGDLNLTLHPTLRLRAGVRADALSFRVEDRLESTAARPRREAFGVHVGPKATVELRPGRRWRLFASYGNGFRSPPALALGQGERATFTTVHAGELGARLRLRPWLAATLTGFVTHVAEDLVFDHVTGSSIFTGATTRGGGTLYLQVRPARWLHATFSGTWARSVRHDTGDQLPYAPPLVLRLDVDGRREVARLLGRPLALFGSVGVSVIGERPLPFGERSRAVGLVDVGVGATVAPVTLSFEAHNLADVRWRDGEFVYASNFDRASQGSLLPARHFTAGRPLSLQGTLTLNF